MTVNSSSSVFGSAQRRTGACMIVALFVAALLLTLVTPPAAHAATEVTSIDSMQVAVSLEGTSTTFITMGVAVPTSVPLPCSVNIIIPGGYTVMEQKEFDTNPSSPTGDAAITRGAESGNGSIFTVTLSKSHNFYVTAGSPENIYNSSAMGTGGVPLAAFSISAATDISDLLIGIAPPSTGMVGAGGSNMQTFDAGNNVKLYGQEFKNVKKGAEETVQMAFATSQQAQQGEASATAQAQAQQASGFFAQPVVWVLAAVLVIVVIVLVTVIMRQRRSEAEAADEAEDWDDAEGGDGDGDDDAEAEDAHEDEDTDDAAEEPVSEDEGADEEHAAATSDS